MPWTVGTFHKKRWYHSPWPWIAAAILASAAFLLLPHAQSLYRAWNEKRRVARAEESFTAGDYKDAILRARMALQRNPHSIPATRIFAKSLEALGSPEALAVRQHLERIGGNDIENSLAIAAAMWKANNFAGAERTLSEIPPEGRTGTRFHELSGRLAARRNDYASATKHWAEALRLAPGNAEFALELASAELRANDEPARAAALARLAELREKPESRTAAIRLLLADATTRHEASTALALATTLIEQPDATFFDKLRRLTVLQKYRRTEANAYLTKVQAESVSDPKNVFLVLTWMNENGLALAIPEWRDTLPPEAIDLPQIRSVLAEAEARASNWTRLRDSLAHESWKELEFLRFAYLCRAAERLADETAMTAAWSSALASTNGKPWPLETLARTLLGWGWTARAEEVMWRLAEGGSAPRWVADHLWKAASAARNTAQMYQAARALVALDPRNVVTRNNYVALALLTGNDADSPHKLAAVLFQEAPTDPVVATTYGFSLYRQGRAADAVTVMKTFPREKLREPNVALYHALFLSTAGRLAEAQEYLKFAESAPMLPEERLLFAQAGGTPAAHAEAATPR